MKKVPSFRKGGSVGIFFATIFFSFSANTFFQLKWSHLRTCREDLQLFRTLAILISMFQVALTVRKWRCSFCTVELQQCRSGKTYTTFVFRGSTLMAVYPPLLVIFPKSCGPNTKIVHMRLPLFVMYTRQCTLQCRKPKKSFWIREMRISHLPFLNSWSI